MPTEAKLRIINKKEFSMVMAKALTSPQPI